MNSGHTTSWFCRFGSKHCIFRCFTGIHLKGEFDLANMKSISYESRELKERLLTNDFLLTITVRNDLQALTLPLNDDGLYVSNFMMYKPGATPEEYVRALLDNEDISFNVVFTNDWQGHFASAETLQKGRVFLAGVCREC